MLASTSTNGNSSMKSGCTIASAPVASAAPWNTAERTTPPMPSSQVGVRSRSHISPMRKPLDCGTTVAARRCITVPRALAAAARRAKISDSRVSIVVSCDEPH